MREIKFRYTCVKPMPFIFHEDFNIEQIENGEAARWMVLNITSSGIVHRRRFTGLPDKNGKEIYEGDIVRLLEYGEVDKAILFHKGAFCVHGFNWDNNTCQVIGNIYENPNLLKTNS